jgi:hypothetical protein
MIQPNVNTERWHKSAQWGREYKTGEQWPIASTEKFNKPLQQYHPHRKQETCYQTV